MVSGLHSAGGSLGGLLVEELANGAVDVLDYNVALSAGITLRDTGFDASAANLGAFGVRKVILMAGGRAAHDPVAATALTLGGKGGEGLAGFSNFVEAHERLGLDGAVEEVRLRDLVGVVAVGKGVLGDRRSGGPLSSGNGEGREDERNELTNGDHYCCGVLVSLGLVSEYWEKITNLLRMAIGVLNVA